MTAPWGFRRGLWDCACFVPVLAAVAAVSAVTGAVGSIAAGQAQQNAENYNAQVDRNNAIQAAQASDAQAAASEQATTLKLGKQTAAYAGSGVEVGTGSPVDVLTSTAAAGKLDAMTLRYGGQVRAQNDISAGQLATYQGNADATAGYLNAGSTLLTGAGSTIKASGANPMIPGF